MKQTEARNVEQVVTRYIGNFRYCTAFQMLTVSKFEENQGGKRHSVVAVGYPFAHHPAASFILALIMEHHSRSFDPALYPAGTPIDAGSSAVSWSAIMAGSTSAIALSLVLLSLGSGFGLAAVSPWPGAGPSPKTFTIAAGIWLIITQWLSSGLGGYIAGRMRTRWQYLHSDEVFFRDTAHGLLTWATATIIVAAVALISSALIGSGAGALDEPVTRDAAEVARKVAASFSIFTAISMLIGAFIACVGAAIGGRLRDRHP
ncbi:MAG: hypothetical protein ABIM50_08760 [Novosphingobium sp.]